MVWNGQAPIGGVSGNFGTQIQNAAFQGEFRAVTEVPNSLGDGQVPADLVVWIRLASRDNLGE